MIKKFSRIVVRDGYRYLVIHNIKEGRNRWEFPGGTLEEGESSQAGGSRELKEEVGLEIEKGSPITLIDKIYLNVDGEDWEGDFWLIEKDFVLGTPRIMESKFDGMRWVNASEYSRLPQIPALGVDIIRQAECNL